MPLAASARHLSGGSTRPPPLQHYRLPITEQAVHEVLLAQQSAEMPAAELSSLFSPRDDVERLKLTRAIAKICDVCTAPSGEPGVRLRGASRTPPLPIDALAVRALLLAQPHERMDAQALRERFSPADEAERQRLVVAIGQVGELVAADRPGAGPLVRLRRADDASTPPRGGDGGGGGGASPASVLGQISDDVSQPVTSVERDLVRKVLSSAPGGALSAAQLAKMIAPGDSGAKRRLARVVAEVARVAERPDAHGKLVSVLVLRDTTNANDEAGGGAAAGGASGSGSIAGSGGGGVVGAPATGTARGPRTVTEEMVVGLLRAKGGKMLSSVLISQLQPLDSSGKRALAAIVQRVCRTQLPASATGVGASGAVVVLREALLTERVEARAASTIQRWQRTRQAELLAAVSAAIRLQALARRVSATHFVSLVRLEAHAALGLQSAARRRLAVREAQRARTALHAAVCVQMLGRRWLLRRRVRAREATRDAAVTAVQAAARGASGRREVRRLVREAMLARESPEERERRVERERTQLLKQKLLRRRKQQAASSSLIAPASSSAIASTPRTEAYAAAAVADAPQRAVAVQPSALPSAHVPPPSRPQPSAAFAELEALAALVPADDDDDDDAAEACAEPATTEEPPDVAAAGEDFMAAMQRMMQQHGAGLGASM